MGLKVILLFFFFLLQLVLGFVGVFLGLIDFSCILFFPFGAVGEGVLTFPNFSSWVFGCKEFRRRLTLIFPLLSMIISKMWDEAQWMPLHFSSIPFSLI